MENDTEMYYQSQPVLPSSLPLPYEDEPIEQVELNVSKSNFSRILPVVVAIVILTVTISITTTFPTFNSPFSSLNSVKPSRGTSNTLSLSFTNEYETYDGSKYSYPFLLDAYLIEPATETVISLDSYSADCVYSLEIEAASTSASSSAVTLSQVNESSWEVSVLSTGQYAYTVTATCTTTTTSSSSPSYASKYSLSSASQATSSSSSSSSSSTVSTISESGVIWVKYVRRELTSLSDTDRDAFLDALMVMYTVPTDEGVALYGDKYKSVHYFASVHIDAAGNPVCDEMHAGAGFMNGHLFLGNYLEQALQAVNPKLSLHFWEYATAFSSDAFTSHVNNQLDGGRWSEVLSETYFGSNDPVTGRILDGRWTNATLPVVDSAFFLSQGIDEGHTFFPSEEEDWLAVAPAHLSSPYGLLRPPWNYNPSAFLTRYNNVAGIASVQEDGYGDYLLGTTCDDYVSYVLDEVVGQSFDNVLMTVKAGLHGSVHDLFGGQRGEHAKAVDAVLQSQYGLSDNDILLISEQSHAFLKAYVPSKDYYSSDDYPVYPLQCSDSEDDTVSALNCTCVDYYFESGEQLSMLVEMFFQKFMHSKYTQHATVETILNMDLDEASAVMKLICGRMAFDGEFTGSSSAIDPLFWVVHPAMERVLQRARFAGLMGDYNFTVTSDCSGHSAEGTKLWLDGYVLDGEIAEGSAFSDITAVSNSLLSTLLDPTTSAYEQHISYIYHWQDTGCSEVDAMFSTVA